MNTSVHGDIQYHTAELCVVFIMPNALSSLALDIKPADFQYPTKSDLCGTMTDDQLWSVWKQTWLFDMLKEDKSICVFLKMFCTLSANVFFYNQDIWVSCDF